MKYSDGYGKAGARLIERLISFLFFPSSNIIDTHDQLWQFNLALEKKITYEKLILPACNNPNRH
jgi:hypothetical protein